MYLTKRERRRILKEIDVPAAQALAAAGGVHISSEGALRGIHKARLHSLWLSREERQTSLDFLRASGSFDLNGLPLPEELPE